MITNRKNGLSFAAFLMIATGFSSCSTANAQGPTPSEAFAIKLNWSDNSDNEDGFEVERKIVGGEFETLVTLPTDSETYVDESILVNVTYVYRVRAFNQFGFSGYTNEGSGMVGTSPNDPTLISVTLTKKE